MSLSMQRARVRAAQLRVTAARAELARPAAALIGRGERHPLTGVGIAAGAGFVLAQLDIHPLRIPGLGAVMGGGLVEMAARGMRLIAGMGGDNTQP